MEINFKVTQQKLKRTDKNQPANLSYEYLKCRFSFDSSWEDYSKFAIFRIDDKSYREAIVDNVCIVPYDALLKNGFGLTVYGMLDDVRATTNLVKVILSGSGFVSEYDESSYFNPDMTETLLELVETKTDKTVFNETITDINEDITDVRNTKVDVSVFDSAIADINEDIEELDVNKTIEIIKQTVADTGYFSTYIIKQGDVALSPKINIPKDYLLKSASIKQCTEKGVPLEDLNVGDWYFDWVLNTKDDTGGETHLYLNASVLTDVYRGDGETIVIDAEGVISVKDNVFASIVHTHTKSDITDFAHTHIESDITDLRDYALESEVYSKSEVDELLHNLNNRIQVNSTKNVIQVGDTTEIYAHTLKNGMPCIQKKIHFFEKLEPSIKLSASQSIIEIDDDVELYAQVKDADGSLAQNMKVHFFKEDDEELINENIETNNLNNDMEEE